MFIYKIWKKDDENFYIGSTGDFSYRKRTHKYSCNNPKAKGYNYKIYNHIRTNGGWDSWNMDIIEECETQDREIEIIKEMKPSLNTQYRTDRKEYMRKYMKEYYKENTDKGKATSRKWWEENADKINKEKRKKCSCECGSEYNFGNRQRHLKSIKHKKYLSLVNI
tara:strand:+ start:25 stop:519 length:495 start_codon:yes stop_codon:yes gene_type:complete